MTQVRPVHIGNLTIANDKPVAPIAGLVGCRAAAYAVYQTLT